MFEVVNQSDAEALKFLGTLNHRISGSGIQCRFLDVAQVPINYKANVNLTTAVDGWLPIRLVHLAKVAWRHWEGWGLACMVREVFVTANVIAGAV